MTKNINDEITGIAEDAREEFDLGDVLRGRSVRTKTVTVFTDEVTGEKLGGGEILHRVNAHGIEIPEVRTWGLAGKVVELSRGADGEEKNAEEIARLKAEIKVLAAKLEETALVVELQAVPPIIKKDSRRAAKKALGINGKVGESQLEDFGDEVDAQLLVRTVVSIKNNASGKTNKGISISGARDLKSLLPETEFDKLQTAIVELNWQRQIAEKAVEDADF